MQIRETVLKVLTRAEKIVEAEVSGATLHMTAIIVTLSSCKNKESKFEKHGQFHIFCRYLKIFKRLSLHQTLSVLCASIKDENQGRFPSGKDCDTICKNVCHVNVYITHVAKASSSGLVNMVRKVSDKNKGLSQCIRKTTLQQRL